MEHWARGTPVWKIAAGLALAVFVITIAGYAARMWMLQQALDNLNEQVQQVTARQQQAMEAAAHRSRLEQEARVRQAEERAAAARAAIDAQRAAELAARQASLEEEARREAAWSRYYRQPTHCSDPPTHESFVECVNGHMRAKRSFDAAYASGKL